MDSTIGQAARAFSSHRFEEAYPYLRAEVRWNSVGGELVSGRVAVIARCNESAAYLAGVTTTFDRCKVIVGADSVAVDTLATYAGSDGETTVIASCDIYDFIDGSIAEITSYTVDVTGER